MEIWKPLKNFPSYDGSSEGRIRNIRTRKILKPYLNEKGYEQVSINRNGQHYTVRVHKIIAETFLGEHPGMDVFHKDLNKRNNNIDNLEWRTRKDIARDSFERGSRQAPRYTGIKVVETGNIYKSVTECAKDTGCDRSEIFKYLAGQRSNVKGYHFEKI